MSGRRILVVDDDASLRRVTRVQLEDEGYSVAAVASGKEAKSVLARNPQDLVIADFSMPGISGVELLKHIRSEYPDTIVVSITAFGAVETAVEAMKHGAYDYITKPVSPGSLSMVVARALEYLSLRKEVLTLRRALDKRHGFQDIVGRSDALAYRLDMAARAAQSDVMVLIHGETGTGKEMPEGRQTADPLETLQIELPAHGVSLKAVEKELIAQALNRFRGNQTRAARCLGLSRKTLIYRMQKYGLRGSSRPAKTYKLVEQDGSK